VTTPPQLGDGYRLVSRDTVGSTNDEAKRLARAGAAEGTLVWAREQTAGRGRRGRSWASPPGNLYLSLVQRPDCLADRAAQLGFVAALAVGDALRPHCETACKWPNDLLAGGRKIAGILLESETGAGGVPAFVVVGVGVNLASAPPDTELPATSVAAETGRAVEPAAVLETFAGHFRAWAARWRADGFAPIRAAWRGRAVALGEPIGVRLETTTLRGRFLDIDEEGALLLDMAGGHRRIAAGEIFPASG
jgi:BirA family biotin operon repressor/biotin-[acetyl-CoA-carboxylase] ligase